MMKEGHLYQRDDGEFFVQESPRTGAAAGCVWNGSDNRSRRDDGSFRYGDSDMGSCFDAVRDLGPKPTWKEVVAMREEVERLRAWKADAMATVSEWDKVVEIARREGQAPFGGSFAEWARNVFERVWAERNRLRAENADLRATLAKEADAPDRRTFADAPLHVAAADADRPLAAGDVVVVTRLMAGDEGKIVVGSCHRVDNILDLGVRCGSRGLHWTQFRRATQAEIAELEAKEREKAVFHFLPDGFTPHLGGQCPVNQRDRVHAFERGGNSIMADAGAIQWAWERPDAPGNIIGYRVVKAWEESKPTNVVDLAGRKLPPIPAGWRLVTDYAAEPHPEAMFTDGQTKEWTRRSRYTSGSAYHEDAAYIVPIVYDVEIPWHGGPCPVAEETEVVVTLRNGDTCGDVAREWFWGSDGDESDIVSYTVPSPKPAEPDLAAVALDPTSVVFATRGMEVGRG